MCEWDNLVLQSVINQQNGLAFFARPFLFDCELMRAVSGFFLRTFAVCQLVRYVKCPETELVNVMALSQGKADITGVDG